MEFKIDVVVEVHRLVGFIGDEELSLPAKRHGKPAVEAAPVARAHLEGQGGEVHHLGVAHAEEIAQRRFDRIAVLVVPARSTIRRR
ncbi:MAG: hypothetical protein R2851_03190 [Caldilineaceae bacterium]